MAKARALKDVSVLIPAGSILVKMGDNYVLDGHTEAKMVETKLDEDVYDTPNFYPVEQVKNMPRFFQTFN